MDRPLELIFGPVALQLTQRARSNRRLVRAVMNSGRGAFLSLFDSSVVDQDGNRLPRRVAVTIALTVTHLILISTGLFILALGASLFSVLAELALISLAIFVFSGILIVTEHVIFPKSASIAHQVDLILNSEVWIAQSPNSTLSSQPQFQSGSTKSEFDKREERILNESFDRLIKESEEAGQTLTDYCATDFHRTNGIIVPEAHINQVCPLARSLTS